MAALDQALAPNHFLIAASPDGSDGGGLSGAGKDRVKMHPVLLTEAKVFASPSTGRMKLWHSLIAR